MKLLDQNRLTLEELALYLEINRRTTFATCMSIYLRPNWRYTIWWPLHMGTMKTDIGVEAFRDDSNKVPGATRSR